MIFRNTLRDCFTFIIVICCLAGCATYALLTVAPINPNDGLPASYVDADTELEFILLPSGRFTMGSPADEQDRDADEGPAHPVSIDSFYIGKYEVTQGQWISIMGENPSQFKGHHNLPVENVSWNNVQDFIKRLNKKTGLTYRLPTEAEWEYACRAGTNTRFYSGNDEASLNEYAWFNINSGGEAHPVGTRKPNSWGLYDMHGNVSEWIGDGRRGYLSRAEHNPKGLPSAGKALHRGGCWLHPAKLCRSANRITLEKDFKTHIIGFRLALDKNALSAAKPQ